VKEKSDQELNKKMKQKRQHEAAFLFNSWRADAMESLLGDAVLLAEFLDPAGGVHDLLLAGVERVAGGTDFHVQGLFHGGAGGEAVAAAARHVDFVVLGMNAGFHDLLPG
jgi:hypothetical protein